ncbi:c-type cytochrome [Piscinibacter sp.]|jgi:mono/diheme cytochrome c family protein|uniref:c-type cytochrome n=1 Tax=Piscinibacter sp. TaxID=1903157 RepID=UPI002F409061
MNKWLKRSVIAIVAVVALGAAALALGSYLGDRKAQRHVEVSVAAVEVPADAASLERGRYLFSSRGCAECHGANGGGREFINDGKSMVVKSPNISNGPGSVVVNYSAVDWVRTIRHGVKPNGRPVFIMPSEDYNRLTDADVGALIAYAKQLPRANGSGLQAKVPALVKTLYAAGVIQDAAEKIDHRLPSAAPVPASVSREHGAYVANMCIGCHGEHLSGGKVPGGPPDWPPAANLTPGEGSAMPRYANAEQFVAMLRSGKRPDGSVIDKAMPFESLGALNDVDAQALYLHLKSLPAVKAGNR